MTDDTRVPPDPVLQRPDGPPGAPGPTRRRRWIVAAVGGGLLLLGIWLALTRLPGWLTRPEVTDATTPAPEAVAADAADARRIQATLFYVSRSGTKLVPTTRDVLYGATPAEQARHIVEAQVEPVEDFATAIPAGTTVRTVFLTSANEAYVDLGGAIRAGHTGGSLDEALAIYAIVNAVTTNLPDIVGVQILIEGREVDTLAGHLDLRFPLARATDWIQRGQ